MGLTASGKSWLGIQLAKLFNGEIISCDSRQIYKTLDIGSAKVTHAEQQEAVHHMLDIINPGEKYDVYQFQQDASKIINEIHSRKKLPILVGGTGLYSRAIVENYDFVNNKMGERKYDVLQIALMPPKTWLFETIAKRNQQRYEQGMMMETGQLLKNGVCPNWLKKIGLDYQLTTKHILGELDWDEFVYWHHTKTMQYAKRQRTWFNREQNTIFLTDQKLYENPDLLLKEAQRLVQQWKQLTQ